MSEDHGLFRSIAHRLAGEREVLPVEGRLPSFDRATSWLNSEPLTPEGLRGRVVLVDFWTYTCVNWLRTLPYVKAWAAKYEDAGLSVVGVHTPEFGFERDLRNVTAQSRHLGVEYPVAVDSDRVLHAERPRLRDHVAQLVLEAELGRVHPDDGQPDIRVLLGPRPEVRERAQPVDAGVRPEVDEHDAAA